MKKDVFYKYPTISVSHDKKIVNIRRKNEKEYNHNDINFVNCKTNIMAELNKLINNDYKVIVTFTQYTGHEYILPSNRKSITITKNVESFKLESRRGFDFYRYRIIEKEL